MKKPALIAAAALVTALAVFLLMRGNKQTSRIAEVPPSERIVAEVNGRFITYGMFQSQYDRFMQRIHIPDMNSPEALKELKVSFLNKLIETELLKQEAELRALTVSEEELDREINLLKQDYPKDTLNEALERIGLQLEEWKKDRTEKLLIDKLIEQEIDSIIHVSDQDVEKYYKAHTKEFQQPLMVRARQIVVATEDEAKSIRTRILRGEDFAEMAKRFSLSPDAEQGGDLGKFAKGQMPEEFDRVVFRYRVGSVSRVVKSPYGFHIFKVEDRIRPRTQTLKEVSEQIRQKIFQGRQESFFNEWLNQMKDQAQITLYPENLDSQ